MTIIEQRTMDAIQRIERKTRDANQIDWEQRRYEIARETMATSMVEFGHIANAAEYAVKCADALIEELKRTKQ